MERSNIVESKNNKKGNSALPFRDAVLEFVLNKIKCLCCKSAPVKENYIYQSENKTKPITKKMWHSLDDYELILIRCKRHKRHHRQDVSCSGVITGRLKLLRIFSSWASRQDSYVFFFFFFFAAINDPVVFMSRAPSVFSGARQLKAKHEPWQNKNKQKKKGFQSKRRLSNM